MARPEAPRTGVGDREGLLGWLMLAPSLVIVLTTLSISVLGDWLRDRLDPTLR